MAGKGPSTTASPRVTEKERATLGLRRWFDAGRLEAFDGTGPSPTSHITGAWVYGAKTLDHREESPIDAPPMVLLEGTDRTKRASRCGWNGGESSSPPVAGVNGDGGGGGSGLAARLTPLTTPATGFMLSGTGDVQHWGHGPRPPTQSRDFFPAPVLGEDSGPAVAYVVGRTDSTRPLRS